MGAEGVSTLVWILIWVGLFFVMMRYGCGAHMRGGHRHHGGEGGRSGSPQAYVGVEEQGEHAHAGHLQEWRARAS